jgi:hypothetical protein
MLYLDMVEEFDKEFPIGKQGEIRVFHFKRIVYAASLLKYAITSRFGNPVNMVQDKNNKWMFEYKLIIVPIEVQALETDFAKVIEKNENQADSS